MAVVVLWLLCCSSSSSSSSSSSGSSSSSSSGRSSNFSIGFIFLFLFRLEIIRIFLSERRKLYVCLLEGIKNCLKKPFQCLHPSSLILVQPDSEL